MATSEHDQEAPGRWPDEGPFPQELGQLEADIPLESHVLARGGPGHPWVWLLIPALVVLVLFFVAALGLAIARRDSGVASPAAPAPPPAVAQAPQGANAQQGTGAQGDCSVEPTAISVVSEVTAKNQTDHATVFQGTTTVTNTSDAPIYVALRKSQSTGASGRTDEGWFGGPYLLAPGEQRVELTSGQSFTSGDSTWTLLTDYAPFAGTMECLTQIATPDGSGYDTIAVPIEDPLPVGP